MEWAAVLQGVRMMRFRDVFGRCEERELSQLEAAELLGVRSSVTQEASKSAIPSRLSIPGNNNTPPSDDSRPPSNRAHNSLLSIGDKPGR